MRKPSAVLELYVPRIDSNAFWVNTAVIAICWDTLKYLYLRLYSSCHIMSFRLNSWKLRSIFSGFCEEHGKQQTAGHYPSPSVVCMEPSVPGLYHLLLKSLILFIARFLFKLTSPHKPVRALIPQRAEAIIKDKSCQKNWSRSHYYLPWSHP